MIGLIGVFFFKSFGIMVFLIICVSYCWIYLNCFVFSFDQSILLWLSYSFLRHKIRRLDFSGPLHHFFYLLLRILSKAEDCLIHSIKVSRKSILFSHLMFSNDLTIYCHATAQEAFYIVQCLQTFCLWSGQLMNLEKSSIHFSNNALEPAIQYICSLLKMKESDHNSKYLKLHFYKTN